VFGAIKAAEARLLESQDSKAYLGPEGDMGFVHALMPYIFGSDDSRTQEILAAGRIEGMQAPGGTGGVRLAVDLAKAAGVRRVIMGTRAGPTTRKFSRMSASNWCLQSVATDGTADLAALRTVLESAGEGDAVLLHGCCHNPTGVDYSNEQWEEIAAIVAERGVLPILDLAYQGLATEWTKTPLACGPCSRRCRRRWSAIRATRTSGCTVTASARSTR
jgi:aromatic-amino-acid transaminase